MVRKFPPDKIVVVKIIVPDAIRLPAEVVLRIVPATVRVSTTVAAHPGMGRNGRSAMGAIKGGHSDIQLSREAWLSPILPICQGNANRWAIPGANPLQTADWMPPRLSFVTDSADNTGRSDCWANVVRDQSRVGAAVDESSQRLSQIGSIMSETRIQELEQQIQQLEEQLLQTQRLSSVGALASSITHEFNNILTTVINYAKMGVRHKDARTRDKAFDRILSAGQRASKITTGMLAYARNSSDRMEPVELNKLLEDVLVLMQKDLQMHRIGVDLDVQPGVWALANSSQIQQILMNLIVNARQAMDEGGRLKLRIAANADDNWAEISVGDSGCGIPHEQLQKIFDPFYTTKKTDARGQGGTGIGLSVCRRIIEAHKGRIRVESEVGRGTTFTLKLPLSESPAGLIDTSAA